MDALYVISCEWPSRPLSESTAAHPLLHNRITELQVHTLLDLDFRGHEIWTQEEIYSRLREIARRINATACSIYPNQLTDTGVLHPHTPYVHVPKGHASDPD